jgi:REP element-mobilizing transposase RayT
LSCVFIHVVFSTKDRRPTIGAEIRGELGLYLAGIARNKGCQPVIQCATADHVHCLIGLDSQTTVANLIRDLKANSSRWLNKRLAGQTVFAWQNGYGAFSVSKSNLELVKEYVATQEEHHRKMTFQQELLALLKKHDIPYDEKYLWA